MSEVKSKGRDGMLVRELHATQLRIIHGEVRQAGGNLSLAARNLGLSRQGLKKFLAKHPVPAGFAFPDRKLRLRVISDGTAVGTRLIDPGSGLEIDGVMSIKWEIDAQSNLSTIVTVLRTAIDIEADAKIVIAGAARPK